MKLLIAGSRDINENEVKPIVTSYVQANKHRIEEIISGNAKGVDLVGEEVAKIYNIKITSFPVTKDDWNILGKAAGPMRNKKMVEYCDEALLIWNGSSQGTKGTIDMMVRFRKPFTLNYLP